VTAWCVGALTAVSVSNEENTVLGIWQCCTWH